MKTIITSILAVLMLSMIGCSETQVPEKVAAAFKAKYPAAKDVEWGKESDSEFEAEFELNGKEMSANFDPSGKWLETEAQLAAKDLPAPVLATLKSQFGDNEVKKVESLEKAGEPVVYEVKLEQDEAELEVVLDSNGNVIKKEVKGEENEENEGEEQEAEEQNEGTEKISVPKTITVAFKAKFPAAKEVEWSKESPSEYEAEFELNGKEMSANFDASGKWLEAETKLDKKYLPASVLSTLKSQFGGSEVKKAESLEKAGEPVVYEIKLEQDENEVEVVLDASGKVIKKEAKGEEVKESEESEENEKEAEEDEYGGWTKSFDMENRHFSPTGKNPYFILQPGYQLVLEGEEDDHQVRLVISVLNETEKIGNVETRVVEERESSNGQLVEVSRNYFAIDKKTQDVFYFGENVDIYKSGKIAGHGGAWRADEKGNHAGVMMPGSILIGARYYQEVAPGVAMDRAEIVNRETELKTPAGTFKQCLKIEETTPLEPDAKEYKIYAPGIGLIKDGTLLLTKHGFNIF